MRSSGTRAAGDRPNSPNLCRRRWRYTLLIVLLVVGTGPVALVLWLAVRLSRDVRLDPEIQCAEDAEQPQMDADQRR